MAAPSQDTSGVKWQEEADIICVGSGAAALTAAIIADSNGDEVIILEKRATVGGTTAKSGGVHWIPNNPLLAKKGIVDDKADAMAYLARLAYPEYFVASHPTLGLRQQDYDLLAAFYDNGSAAVARLWELGVYPAKSYDYKEEGRKISPEVEPRATTTPDYFDHATENKVKTGRGLVPVRADGISGNGADLINYFSVYLEKRKRQIRTEQRVTDVVQDESGRVLGVVVQSGGATQRLRARKAVIFGTGGFAQNPQLLRRLQRTRIYGSCSSSGSEGDLLPIAARAGAAFGNMAGAWRAEVPLEQMNGKPLGSLLWMPSGDSMIYVNKYGERFVDEYRPYNSRAKAHEIWDSTREEYPNHLAFMIFDQRTLDLYGGTGLLPAPGENPQWLASGKDLEALTQDISARLQRLEAKSIHVQLDPKFTERLRQTIHRFNGFAHSGVDADFGRGSPQFDREMFNTMSLPRNAAAAQKAHPLKNPTLYPIAAQGPYYAILVGAGVLDTNGGPVINAKAQIVDFAGQPVPGLYGAGNCVACPTREAYYAGGGTIGLALTFGYVAATAAHREPLDSTR